MGQDIEISTFDRYERAGRSLRTRLPESAVHVGARGPMSRRLQRAGHDSAQWLLGMNVPSSREIGRAHPVFACGLVADQ
jgi:hypothetical protein